MGSPTTRLRQNTRHNAKGRGESWFATNSLRHLFTITAVHGATEDVPVRGRSTRGWSESNGARPRLSAYRAGEGMRGDSDMLRVAIIAGSTRPGRKGDAVARWVYEIADSRGDAEFELVDIKEYDLPLLDEPLSATLGQYSKDHTKAWSAEIASFDAFVFVT